MIYIEKKTDLIYPYLMKKYIKILTFISGMSIYPIVIGSFFLCLNRKKKYQKTKIKIWDIAHIFKKNSIKIYENLPCILEKEYLKKFLTLLAKKRV